MDLTVSSGGLWCLTPFSTMFQLYLDKEDFFIVSVILVVR
jgi:hypothetical protein